MAKQQQSHVFMHNAANAAQLADAAVADEVYTQRGQTAHFIVSYAQSLGGNGPTLADAVLATCEADYNRLQGWFGNINIGSLPFNVYIKPGANGASHASCPATGLFCDAFNGTDVDLVRSLIVAEEDEVFMGNQGAGWDCGASNGEALSRVLAAEIYPNELTPPGLGVTFASGRNWLDSTRPDWVNNTDPTAGLGGGDVAKKFVAIGCGTLFINWLRFQLGFSLNQVVQAGGTTLAQTYTKLTGRSDGFIRFSALLKAYYPLGQLSGLLTDNPFPIAVIAGGTRLYATNPDTGDIYRYEGVPMSWTKVGGPGSQFAANNSTLYGLSPDGSGVWQFSGTPMDWTQVGGPAGSISAGGDRLYATNPDTGDIYRYEGVPMSWTKVGASRPGS
jgi:hypothetical protein